MLFGKGLQRMNIKEGWDSARGILFAGLCMLSLWPGANLSRGQTCGLYPLAIPSASLSNAVPGVTVLDIFNGTGPEQFGWLSWGGSPSEPALVASLTPPGNSATYVNPDNAADHQISIGDWVSSKPGVSDSKQVREALDALKNVDITIPVWNQTRGAGDKAAYRISGFATVRVLSYHLPQQNRITARFIGHTTCAEQNLAPVVNAGADQTITLLAGASLVGSATDDGLPVGSALSVTWSKVSGAGTVTFLNANSATTTATFSDPGTYVLRLVAGDSQLATADEVVITVNRENHAPIADAQTVVTDEDVPVNLTLAGSDADGDPLTFVIVTQPAHGTLTGTPPNLSYISSEDYHGPDAFTFRVNDGLLDSGVVTIAITNRPVNDAPVADARSLSTLEDTALAIALSGSDVEGSPLAYTIVAGPTHGTLTGLAPNVTYQPAANFHGSDTFSLRVNDGQLDSATAVVSLAVISVNDAPIVATGSDSFINQPTNSVLLVGTVDDDFFFETNSLTTEWTVVSGPGTVVFADAQDVATTATFDTSGIYTLRLTASDWLLEAYDDVVVTVNARPTVNAGADLTITYPASVTLQGAASDDGIPTNSAPSVGWSKVFGPGTVYFADAQSTNSAASFSEGGIYVLRLTVTDSAIEVQDEVTVTVNKAPIVDAGSDQTVTNLSATLAGSIVDDGIGQLSSAWTKVSGPGTVTFSTNAPAGAATFGEPGIYTLRLTANDSFVEVSDDVIIVVNGAPVVTAGADSIVNFPAEATLNGTVVDDGIPTNGTISAEWIQVSGPGIASFVDAHETNTVVSFSQAGVYVLRLVGNDGQLAASDDVMVTVNQAPQVNAGLDFSVIVGQEVGLHGLVSDDGIPTNTSLSTTWTHVGGAGIVQITDLGSPETLAKFVEEGTYVLRLTANDSLATNFDEVSVRVLPVNRAPVVVVGPKQIITLPAVANLHAVVSDDGQPEGSEVAVVWSKVSGPGMVTFANAGTADTTAAFSEAGTYVLRLTASDFLLSTWADSTVVVRTAEMNLAPVVNAGPAQTIGLTNTARLAGSVSDDGLPRGSSVALLWTQVSGPGTVSFDDPTLANAQATFSVSGSYILQLTANDSALSVSNVVNITVYPNNQPPVVQAGPDQSITIPDPAVFNPVTGSPTNASANLGLSLLGVDHWNNAIGQPGFGGVAWGTDEGPSIRRNAVAVQDGVVYVAGGYTNAGSTFAKGMASWDGTQWRNYFDTNAIPTTLDDGGVSSGTTVDWLVYDCGTFPFCWEFFGCLDVRGPEIFVGASLFKDLGNLDGHKDMTARWDGSRWRSWVFKQAGNQVHVIKSTPDKVYLGGYFAFQPTNATSQTLTNVPWSYGVAAWDGTNWQAFGSGIIDIRDVPRSAPYPTGVNDYHANVWTLAVASNGDVYAAGTFTMPTPTGVANNIAKWNGTAWEPLGGGITGGAVYRDYLGFPYTNAPVVNGIALDAEGNLYAVGDFYEAGGIYVNRIAKWNGSNWSPLGTGTTSADLGANARAEVVATHGRDVYVGGAFTQVGGIPVSRIAKWNGTFWMPLGTDSTNGVNGEVRSLAVDDTGIYVAGRFDRAGGLPASCIAKWEFAPQPPRVAHLSGSVVDDGLPTAAALTATWSKVDGTGAVTFANPNSPVTTASFSQAGAYTLRLSATDTEFTTLDEVTINVVGNQPPTVDAGSDRSIGLGEFIALAGSVADDGQPQGAAVASVWSLVRGPGPVNFDHPGSPTTIAQFNVPGTYILRLTANDTQFSTEDDVRIVVLPSNQAPFAGAGLDQTVVWPSPAHLSAAVSDGDGRPSNVLVFAWSQVSGPAEALFDNPNTNAPTVFFPQVGAYQFRISASDSELTSFDDVTVTVVPQTNFAIAVYAGPDQVMVAPTNVTLTGIVLGAGSATNTQVQWFVNGPGTVTFDMRNSLTPTVGFTTPGSYEFRLEVQAFQSFASDQVVVEVRPAAGANQPPQVYAGAPQTVPLGSAINLPGAVSDDGLPSGASLVSQWRLVSGPAPASITDSNSPQTTVVFTNTGIFVLELSANDSQLVGTNRVTFTVYDPTGNRPPLVSAGTSQTVPYTNTFTLSGTVTDDGFPTPYTFHRWSQITGPAVAQIYYASVLNPTVSVSAPGSYIFQLTADDGEYTNSARVLITATGGSSAPPAVNVAPVVDAGPSRIVLTPTNSIVLSGFVSDDGLPTGSTVSVQWTVDYADGPVDFSDLNVLTPTVTFEPSDPRNPYYYSYYNFIVEATDGAATSSSRIDVIVAASELVDEFPPPLVDAGPDLTITLPTVPHLQGSVMEMSEIPASAEWSLARGPAPVTFGDPSDPHTSVIFTQPGVYVLRLLGMAGFDSSDEVTVTVNSGQPTGSGGNLPPVVDAGGARTILFSEPTVTLGGIVADDGLPAGGTLSSTWGQVSGPGTVVFGNAASPTTTATFSTNGNYVLRLVVSDSALSSTNEAMIRVVVPSAPTQLPPVVDAGPNLTVTLPADVTLHGLISDDGLPYGALQYRWDFLSGPVSPDTTDEYSTNLTIHFTAPGVYAYRLNGSDYSVWNSDDVFITVLSPTNRAPFVAAGAAQTVTLAAGAALVGLVGDDGVPSGGSLSTTWSKLGGPGSVVLAQITNAPPFISAQAGFSLPGDYVFSLVASDSILSSTSLVNITVVDLDPHGNHAPLVSAGPDQNAPSFRDLPLHGSVSDDGLPAGHPVSALWSVVSGPNEVRFSDPSQPTATASFYVNGTYVLRLAANDGQLTAADTVTFTIQDPTNEPPSVFAGGEVTVTRPEAADLQGMVFDDDLPLGYPLTYQWSTVSGPGTVTFVSGGVTNAGVTPWLDVDFFDAWAGATFSTNGTYLLRLTATDTQYTNTDEVTVTVLAGVNSAPNVDAGPNFAISMPDAALLHPTITDDGLPDGRLQINWSKVSGPGEVAFTTLNGVYRATFTSPGTYVLRVTANDGELTASDDVTVTVYNAPAPLVQLIAPGDAAIVTAPTNLIGTASSPILQSCTVRYRLKPAEDSLSAGGAGQGEVAWSVLASNTASVISNTLALFDPTLLLNGIYEVQLTATDTLGRTSESPVQTLIVDRNLKIGHFTLSFNDLSVPVAGLPIQITRTYDSRAAAAGIQGDFGVGWTMDIRNVRLQKNRSLSANWEEYTTGSAHDLSLAYHLNPGKARVVAITFPDGRVEKFRLDPNPMDRALFPINYPQWRFTPLGNTRGSLVPAGYDEPDGDFLYFTGSIPGIADLVDLNGFTDWLLYDGVDEAALRRYPTLFRYTTPEGYRYLIDEVAGLQSMTDPNGNTLLIGTNSLTWTNTLSAGGDGQSEVASLSIAFQRDAAGRITNIVDAAGHAMSYAYGTNGNLVAFTDRVGQTNGFAYTNAAFPHHLTGIMDARGVTPVQNQYDASGRLVGNLDAFGNAIRYGHDLANNREYVTNRLGQVTISEYDIHGNVTRVIDPLGGQTLSSYDDTGNLLSVVDPLGRTNIYTYDALDNRLTATDPLGNTTTFSYGAQRRVTSVTDPRGNTITNVFDASGNLLNIRDPLGNVTRFAYNSSGLPTAMTNALSQVMRFGYDAKGRLTNEVDAVGHATGYVRDASGNLLTQTTTRTTPTGLETLTVSFQYDAQGRLTNSIFPDGSSAQTIYNTIGKPAVTIDQQGRQTVMEYDALGRVTRTVYPDGNSDSSGYDVEGRRTFSTNRVGQVTRFDYDELGRLFRTVMPDGASTRNYFNAASQLIISTDARGNSTFYGYDAAGRSSSVTNALGQVSLSFYDASGNVTNAVDAAGRSTRFIYDELNRQVQTVFADGTTQTTWFDVLGRRTHEQDQAGKVTAFGYDTLGRMTAVTNALGYVTSYTYDELGQQLTQTDANNHTTAFEYDSLGRRVKRTLPGNQVETYAYSIGGLLTNRTDFNGYVTTFAYDGMNRLLAKVPDARRGEPSVTYGYNVLGLRTNMTDASGVTTFAYDGRNRLIAKATPQGTLTYGYDSNGNVTNLASLNANGAGVGYEFDALNRLNAVNDSHLGRTAYSYDEVGNLSGYTYPNGVSSFFAYDDLNRLTNLASGKLLTPLANYAYTVGAAWNRLTASEVVLPNSVPHTINRVYQYDDVYRMTGETINGVTNNGATSYGYDPVGNRLSRLSTINSILSTSASFDANDRLNTDSYDANGNTLIGAGFGQLQPDQYDFENRLVTRYTAQGTVTIVYDGDGNRVRKTVTTSTNTVTTRFLVDDLNPTGYAQVMEELTSSTTQPTPTVTRVYAYGHNLISQDCFNGATWLTSFYGYDGHNNVRYLTDAAGNITDTYDYDAFGKIIGATGNTPNWYLFTGEQYDLDLGLYYLRARYHNPDTGRFWTQDSFEGFSSDPTSLHKYTYCGNNPVNAFDPSGRYSIAEMSISTGLWSTARSIFGATIGGITGSAAAGYGSILHGQVSNQEIASAMTRGFKEGAYAGAFFGGVGSLGTIGSVGVSAIGMVYSGIGFLAAYQSYSNGNIEAGNFEAAMAAVGALASAPGVARGSVLGARGLTAALENYYGGPRNFQNVEVVPEALANAKHPDTPPYVGNAIEFKTGNAIYFARLIHEGNSIGGGQWLAPLEGVVGKTGAQLKQLYGLQYEPNAIQLVRVASGTKMRAGRVGSQAQWGVPQNSSAVQYELLQKIDDSSFNQTTFPIKP